jgi:hypothetical protein
MARASRRAHWRDARLDISHIAIQRQRRNVEPGTSHRYAPFRPPRGSRITCPVEYVNSRTGGRAVHGVVPPAFELQRAQHRVGLPREWRCGEARRRRQAGRRDDRRWPRTYEDEVRLTPPQGGEPERRRDQRRMRRKAGVPENQVPAPAAATGSASANCAGPVTVHGHRTRSRSRTKPPRSTQTPASATGARSNGVRGAPHFE